MMCMSPVELKCTRPSVHSSGGTAFGPCPPAAEGALSSPVVARATGWLVAESVGAVKAGVAGAASVRICSVAKRLSFLGVVV